MPSIAHAAELTEQLFHAAVALGLVRVRWGRRRTVPLAMWAVVMMMPMAVHAALAVKTFGRRRRRALRSLEIEIRDIVYHLSMLLC